MENVGHGGISVRLSGMADASATTDANGQYAFTGLRAGTYSVEISGFDMDEVGFGSTSSSATVGVGESKIISFDGTYLRTAGIEGRVSIEGEGLSGVTVSLGGSESGTTTTDAGGRYAFAKLKAGVYTVAISGYDADDYEFESTSESVTLATGETANVPFEGTLLRTAGISGRVSVGGMGLAGVTVSLSGMDDPREATTNAQGQYGFAGLAEGTYVLSMTNPDPAEYSFETERSVTLAQSESKIENFEGTSLRTAGVAGMVTVEGSGISDVTVTLIRVTGATSGDVMGIRRTGDDGSYAFGDLLAGAYRVDISGFDAEYAFETTNWQGQVATGDVADASFAGTIIRTASIGGMVTVEGSGKEGVTVSLAGGTDGVDDTRMTRADGSYTFDGLRRGDYTVTITNPDEALYSFTSTEHKVSVGVGQTQGDVSFAGTMLRQGSISGRVHAEGTGIPGATVTLAGAMDDTAETNDQGNYAFTDLGPGTYVVSLTNPDEVAYEFASMTENVTLDNADDKKTVNFDGTHTRTASVSGMAYIDEAPADGMYTANEPALAHAGLPVVLQGPGVNDILPGATDSTGAYMFSNLMAGSYRVLVNMDEMTAAAIAAAGFAYKGELTGEVVSVDAGGSASVNFPFGITMQTIGVGARMGVGEEVGAPVAGVMLALYANADMTGMLGEATTDEMGVATFNFARADNTGPGGNDNLAFISVAATGHDALAVSNNGVIEVSYMGVERVAHAPAALTLANTMANFQFWVKSDADARGGDMGLGGWATEVTMGEDTIPLMVVDEDGDTMNATMPTDTAMASRGRAGLSYSVGVDDLPATFNVMVGEKQAGAMGEMFDQGDALMHTHDGLTHPAMNTMEMNDLGPVYVTFTTQTLTVGVYREIDDEPGFTDYRAPMGGDARPVESVGAHMSAQLLTRDSRNRLRPYEYDHDGKESTDDISSMEIDKNGMASFPHLPADEEFTVRLRVGSGRMLVGETDAGDIEASGADLDIGMSTGSFGEASGAGPEVELCSLTTSRRAKECATFAYQWETGSVSGTVAGAGGASVSLTAETDADDRSTKTGGFGKYSISDIQDGEYELTTPNTADNSFSPKGGFELEIYHDETEDDEDEDTEYVGTADANPGLDFTATKLRLSIKGFVANDNGDGRARGNESMSGVTVNLLAIAKDGVSKDKKDTMFNTAATTETDGSGFYEFNDLTEGGKYYVEVAGGDDYMGLKDLDDGPNNKSAVVSPDEYPTLNEGAFALPSWDHMDNTAGNGRVTVSARAPSTVSATLENFALVFTNNNISGSVNNLSGSNGGILVEGAMCPSYTPGDEDNDESCPWTQGDVFRTTTDGFGGYEFDGLTEGYYAVWFTGGGLMAANVDDEGKADDDADNMGAGSHITSVMGRNDFSTRNSFTVYSARAGTADDLTELAITGLTAAEDTAVSLGTAANIPAGDDQGANGTDDVSGFNGTVTFAGATADVAAKASAGASISITAADGTDGKARGCAGGACSISFDGTDEDDPGETTITIKVTAGNGYDDHEYTVEGITRTDPAGNEPTSIEVGGTTVSFTNNIGNASIATDATTVEVDVDLVAGQSVSASSGGDSLTGEVDATDETLVTFTVATSGAQTAVTITVTSEDGVDNVYTLNLQRS